VLKAQKAKQLFGFLAKMRQN